MDGIIGNRELSSHCSAPCGNERRTRVQQQSIAREEGGCCDVHGCGAARRVMAAKTERLGKPPMLSIQNTKSVVCRALCVCARGRGHTDFSGDFSAIRAARVWNFRIAAICGNFVPPLKARRGREMATEIQLQRKNLISFTRPTVLKCLQSSKSLSDSF